MKLSISLAFVAWLVFNVDWKEAFSYLKNISFLSIAAYVAVLLSGMAISAYKWKILADSKGFKNSFGRYFQLYLAGTFINNFMPSFIGGDAYKAYRIGNKEKKYVSAATSVMIDRITGLMGAVILSSLFAALNWRTIFMHGTLLMICGVVFLLAAVSALALMLVSASVRFPFWEKISAFLPENMSATMKDFAGYGSDKKIFFGSFLLAVVFNLVGIAMANHILLRGLGISMGTLDYLSVIFLISIVSAIPASINNIGIKEWAYITFFGFFGIASSGVLVAALLGRIIQMVVSFAALPYYLRNK